MSLTTPETPIISVSELNQFAKGVLEMNVGKIKVMGEISNLAKPASGHWYFTLKDDNAQIRCAMFRNRSQLIRARVENGMQIILHGNVSLYEQRGEYQLIADYLEEAGLGALQRRFEQLKQQLNNEGLFDTRYKKPLPQTPAHIAVITSATGAAIHDILKVLNNRYPLLKVTVIPASVQGDAAVGELCHALHLAEQWNQQGNPAIEAIIIGRGGGSIEDLWAFNEEKLARAIFACSIPIISAVGHETDITIADFVADLRAATPSAAAEIISPDISNISQHLDYLENKISQRLQQQITQKKTLLASLRLGLKHPKDSLQNLQKQFSQFDLQLKRSLLQQLEKRQQHLRLLQTTLQHFSPNDHIKQAQQQLTQTQHNLMRGLNSLLQQKQQQWQQQAQLLNSVSPLATLQRGYSISHDAEGKVLRDAKQLKIGDSIKTQLQTGTFESQVTKITKPSR